MRKHGVRHKTRNTKHIALPSAADRALATGKFGLVLKIFLQKKTNIRTERQKDIQTHCSQYFAHLSGRSKSHQGAARDAAFEYFGPTIRKTDYRDQQHGRSDDSSEIRRLGYGFYNLDYTNTATTITNEKIIHFNSTATTCATGTQHR